MESQGQGAGEGPEADRRHEHEGEHELVDRAQDVHAPARDVIDRRVRGAVARAEEAEGDGDHDGEDRAPEGDAHRHDTVVNMP